MDSGGGPRGMDVDVAMDSGALRDGAVRTVDDDSESLRDVRDVVEDGELRDYGVTRRGRVVKFRAHPDYLYY